MAALHLIYHQDALADCLRVAAMADTVLLIGPAVQGASQGTHPNLAWLREGLTDAETADAASSGCPAITYEGLVELVTLHHPVVSWR